MDDITWRAVPTRARLNTFALLNGIHRPDLIRAVLIPDRGVSTFARLPAAVDSADLHSLGLDLTRFAGVVGTETWQRDYENAAETVDAWADELERDEAAHAATIADDNHTWRTVQ